MIKKNNIFEKLISSLPYLFVLISSIHFPQDPDLGWHLKYGEYFFQNGKVLRDNIFSQMMPDFKWANTSWGTDLITYFTFHNFGFFGISLLGAVVITLTFYFFSKASKLSFFQESLIFPIIIYFMNPLNTVSFRGQLLSLLFLGILVFILTFSNKNKKILYFISPLFFLWSNLHGQFLIGLFLFLGFIIVKILNGYLLLKTNKRTLASEGKFWGIIFFFSFLSTFINPFGFEIYKEAIAHFINPDLKLIAEYLPFEDLTTPWWNFVVISVLAVWGGILFFAEGKFLKKIPKIFLFLTTYFFSFFIRRYAWMMYYLSIPLLKPVANLLEPNSKKYKYISGSVVLTLIALVVLYLKLPLSKYTKFSWDDYCRYNTCSKAAAEFIIKNKLNKPDLLTMYNWGGWLIWNYPEIKPTIDGRMHLWRDEKGYSGFSEFIAIEQNITDIDKTRYNSAFFSSQKAVYQRLIELVKKGRWKLVYQDNYSNVFIRNK